MKRGLIALFVVAVLMINVIVVSASLTPITLGQQPATGVVSTPEVKSERVYSCVDSKNNIIKDDNGLAIIVNDALECPDGSSANIMNGNREIFRDAVLNSGNDRWQKIKEFSSGISSGIINFFSKTFCGFSKKCSSKVTNDEVVAPVALKGAVASLETRNPSSGGAAIRG